MKKHILLVDDEAEIRELLGQFLEHSGYAVTGVATAREAFAHVRTVTPDLIVSDLQLEESDGLQMIAELKVILPDTPVLLLTGVLFDPQVVAETLSKKVSAYLPKTTPLTKILSEIRRLVGA